MSNKDKKRESTQKNTRKVILLKYKDKRETLILSRRVKNCMESLNIEIQCKKRVNGDTQSVKEVKKTQIQNENYPIFRAQLKDRIVPRCLRDKCRRDVQRKTKQCRSLRKWTSKKKSKNNTLKNKSRSPSIVIISDEECDGLQYDDISSGTLSSYADTEIDTLMESTRKRMKDSDEEWKLLPKARSTSTLRISRSPSLNSLDTLILDTMEEEEFIKEKITTVAFQTNVDNEKCRLYEPKHNLWRKGYFQKNKDDINNQNIIAINSKKINSNKNIKLEPIDINNSRAKHSSSNYKLKIPKREDLKEVNHINTQQTKEVDNNKRNYQYTIKLEPSEANNNSVNQSDYVFKDQKYIINYDKKNNEIGAVITKFEENYTDYSKLNLSLLDIKQELYNDI